jgi:hypothetical protein
LARNQSRPARSERGPESDGPVDPEPDVDADINPSYFVTRSEAAEVKEAVSKGYAVLNDTSDTKSCSTLKNDGPAGDDLQPADRADDIMAWTCAASSSCLRPLGAPLSGNGV